MQSRVLAILIAVVLALVATVAMVVYVTSADRRVIAGQDPVQVWVADKLVTAGTSAVNAKSRDLIRPMEVPRRNVVGSPGSRRNMNQSSVASTQIVTTDCNARERSPRARPRLPPSAASITPWDSGACRRRPRCSRHR